MPRPALQQTDQGEAFAYLKSAGITEAQRIWVLRMEAVFWRQGFLTKRQIAVVQNIAGQHGIEIDADELFRRKDF